MDGRVVAAFFAVLAALFLSRARIHYLNITDLDHLHLLSAIFSPRTSQLRLLFFSNEGKIRSRRKLWAVGGRREERRVVLQPTSVLLPGTSDHLVQAVVSLEDKVERVELTTEEEQANILAKIIGRPTLKVGVRQTAQPLHVVQCWAPVSVEEEFPVRPLVHALQLGVFVHIAFTRLPEEMLRTLLALESRRLLSLSAWSSLRPSFHDARALFAEIEPRAARLDCLLLHTEADFVVLADRLPWTDEPAMEDAFHTLFNSHDAWSLTSEDGHRGITFPPNTTYDTFLLGIPQKIFDQTAPERRGTQWSLGVTRERSEASKIIASLHRRRRSTSQPKCAIVTTRYETLNGLFSFNLHQWYKREIKISSCERVQF